MVDSSLIISFVVRNRGSPNLRHPMLFIKYLIDADGFEVDGEFKTKELAIGDMDCNTVKLFYFKIGEFRSLSRKNQRYVAWVRNNIHGLKYQDYIGDLDQSHLLDIMRSLAEAAARENRFIAFKGGHFERDLLIKVGFGHLAFNIELLGCPKLEVLLTQYDKSYIEDAMRHQCGRHGAIRSKILSITVPHCPRMEVRCFMDFVFRSGPH